MKIKPINGDLIVADVNILNDLDFNRSVIFLAEHNPQGSLGFILNKNLDIKLKDIIPDSNCSFNVYFGGPVQSESLYFIHNIPHIISNSTEISDGIFWGGDFNMIIELLKTKTIKKKNIRFFLGYTGWESNQLDIEIKTDSWLVKKNIFRKKILKETSASLWKDLMKTFGKKQIIWCNAPENSNMN